MYKDLFFIISLVLTLCLAYLPNIEVKSLKKDNVMINTEIKGAVENPGVYNLPYGSTIKDLLAIAKPKLDADLSSLNQSLYIYPESIIFVPIKDEEIKLISINSASESELCTLPGIKEGMATRIIEYRKMHPFRKLEELMNVNGIGIKKYEKIKALICL